MSDQGKRRYRAAYQRKPESENNSNWSKGIRDGFDSAGGVVCKSCFHLKNENTEFKEEIKRLKQKLNYRENNSPTARLPLGAHTPSSKIDIKENSSAENHKKVGGAKKGHKGFGRSSTAVSEADEVISIVSQANACEECHCDLHFKDIRERTVIESVPVVAKKVVYRCERRECPNCKKIYSSKAPVLPKALYGNSLIAQAAVLHFVHGMTMGKIIEIFGGRVSLGGLIDAFHRLGKMAQECRALLLSEFRSSSVKHADETGWRNDGQSGFAWLFATPHTSIFEFKDNRSARVPRAIFGDEQLPGILVVDRYGSYNKMPVEIQYCYAHLLRDVEKLAKDFNDDVEVKDFTARLANLLSQAMRLRNQKLSLAEFETRAQEIKSQIELMTGEPQKHLGIQAIQDLFIRKKDRLYHWAKSPQIPAENNRAERELRPVVINRKVSFGSQSDAGALTRSSIMTLLFTVKKRVKDKSIEEWLKIALDEIALDKQKTFAKLLPPPLSPQ